MRCIVALLTVAALMALMPMVSVMPAFAVANSQASCQGLAASTDTLLGGPTARADVAHDVIGEERPPGALFSEFSQFHEGSTEACFG
jgi:hypothetical protein